MFSRYSDLLFWLFLIAGVPLILLATVCAGGNRPTTARIREQRAAADGFLADALVGWWLGRHRNDEDDIRR